MVVMKPTFIAPLVPKPEPVGISVEYDNDNLLWSSITISDLTYWLMAMFTTSPDFLLQ
jgi:hypothetical protein